MSIHRSGKKALAQPTLANQRSAQHDAMPCHTTRGWGKASLRGLLVISAAEQDGKARTASGHGMRAC